MNQRLVERLAVAEQAAFMRQERRAGSPIRYPEENTEDDVFRSLIADGWSPGEALNEKRTVTRALRLMIHGKVDRQR